MHSVKKRLSITLILCTILSVALCTIFVNIAMNATFNKYLDDVQDKRNSRIVEYFKEIYIKDKKWSKNSGEELQHEAYMSNYCLTLMDGNKNVIWGMDPNEIKNGVAVHSMMLQNNGKGIYSSKTFNINVDGKIVGYAVVGQYSPVLLSEEDINFKLSINKSIAISAVIVIIIVVSLALILSRQFSLPIKRVADTSVRLAEGNYTFRLDMKSNIKEINNLINSINMLGEKLKNQDTLRKRLVADISHEIRTPLNVLQNNIEAMIDGIVPITVDRLNNLNDEVLRFGKLLNNLNYLKESDMEETELKIERVNLKGLISEVCEDFKTIAKEKNVKININLDNNEIFIFGDADRLKQVFINIVSNAVKFNKVGGRVEVNIKENKNNVAVQIADSGIGISEKDLPYIFERLYRGDKSRNEISGNGVGLTIVKNILNMHGAHIEAESRIGAGSSFTIYFNK